MTAEQTIALTSVIVAGVAVMGTILNSFFDRRARAAEARTARSQDRLERTYLELLDYSHRQIKRAEAIRPLMTYEGEPESPSISPEDTARVRSLVSAVASADVRQILSEFADVLLRIDSADLVLTEVAQEENERGEADPAHYGGRRATDFRIRIHDDKQQLVVIEDRLHEQVRRELSSSKRRRWWSRRKRSDR
jgi:hypothetical protein